MIISKLGEPISPSNKAKELVRDKLSQVFDYIDYSDISGKGDTEKVRKQVEVLRLKFLKLVSTNSI